MSERQRKLAHQYLDRGDFVRAAMFGKEAGVTLVCEERGVFTVEYSRERKAAVEEFERELREDKHPERRASARWTLTALRNALAHGSLERALRAALDGFFG